MSKTKNMFEYMGYRLQEVSQNIKVLYMPKGKLVSYALSFDGGETWNVGRNNRTYICGKRGTPQEMIDICIQINEENSDEE